MPADPALLAAVRDAVRHWPARPAVENEQHTISYRELGADLRRASRALRAAGVGTGDTVALHSRRDARLPCALLGAWQAGATVALIDATLPPDRIGECEDQVRANWRLRPGEPVEAITSLGAGSRTASHVLFTSGTTGRPAAVEVGGAAIRGPMNWYRSEFAPGPRDRVPLLAGLGHDPLLRDILVPLTSGATLVVPPVGVFGNPARLAEFLGQSQVSIMHCTPALLELVMAGTPARRAGTPARLAGLPALRLVMSGGAALTTGLVRRLRELTGAVIVNAYGATETPQVASCSILPAGRSPSPDTPDEATVGVGRGVAGAELLLGDDGEVVVRSPHLATGYLAGAGPEGRFRPDPLGQPGYRAYRTGDLAEPGTGPDGPRITGRIYRQISVNGYRVAPEEIENAARRHPLVRQAHAGLYTGLLGDLIELSVEPAAGDQVDTKALRAFLRTQLPGHAVPARIRAVERFGVDRNHKITLTERK